MSVRYVYIPFYLNALITLYNVTLLSIKVSVSYSISEDLVHITLVLLNMPFMNTYRYITINMIMTMIIITIIIN